MRHLQRIGVSAAFAFLLYASFCPCLAQELPRDSEVGVWSRDIRSGARTLGPGEFTGNFYGQRLKFIFYTLPNPILGCALCRSAWFDVVNAEGMTTARYGVSWPGRCGFLATAWFFENPTGLQPLLAGEPALVVSYAVVGASAGGILNILRWDREKGGLEDVSGPWNKIDQVEDVEFRDLNGDGNQEVIFRHHRTSIIQRFGLRSIYRWNGKRFEFERWESVPGGPVMPSKKGATPDESPAGRR